MSIGITDLTAADGQDTLFKRADKALYKAKANGKIAFIHLHVNQRRVLYNHSPPVAGNALLFDAHSRLCSFIWLEQPYVSISIACGQNHTFRDPKTHFSGC